MCNHNSSHNRLFGLLITFIASTLIGATMLVIVATLLLADFMGSLLYAMAIVGGFFTLIALVIYWNSLRPRLHAIQNDITTIAEFTKMIHSGYISAMEHVTKLIRAIF